MGGKRGRAERGRESLVKWNLVTDASEGSAAPAGEDGGCCACLRGRALMYTHAQYSCVCKIAQETDRTWAHIEWAAPLLSVIISRFPPKPFFHLKCLVAADWALAGSATGSGRVELFQPTTRPKTTVGRKKRGRGEERGDSGETFVPFPFFSLHRLPLFLPRNMDQGPKSPALRLVRAGRVARLQLYFTVVKVVLLL